MRKFVLLFLVLTPLATDAQLTHINQNGSFWSGYMSEKEKVMYVWGIKDGYYHGYFAGRADVYLKEEAGTPAKPMSSTDVVNAEHPSVELPNIDIVRQVDRFYSDYRNVSVCMDSAVVQAIESLKGHPWSDTDLAIYRASKDCFIN